MGTGGSKEAKSCNTKQKKVSKKISKKDLLELERKTHFTKKELRKWYKDFIKDSPTGELKVEEFQNIYKQFFPNGDPTKFAKFVFDVFDSNEDGCVSFCEFVTALSITSRGTPDEKLDWAFLLYDVDKDGCITMKEMEDIVEAVHSMIGDVLELPTDEDTPSKRVAKIFSTMDHNVDGKLTLEEFKQSSKNDPYIVQALTMDIHPQ
ncbi:unnamed protein product [Litomosoides sigmodontis]|uniref:EF-hand domain-containing protein n=1 Tax=Litomosoides sigmodontis TaxID=42156 RepID=A0A3P6VC27_LITSI|nr:unnamed protein product [Litomosoides sigmodontis]